MTDEGLSYIVRRLAVHLGARETLFPELIAGTFAADGWLAVEAFHAFSGQYVVPRRLGNVRLGGTSQGKAGQRDIELEVDGQAVGLDVVSMPIARDHPLAAHFAEQGMVHERLLKLGRRPSESAVAIVGYPLQVSDDDWKSIVRTAERQLAVRMVEQRQFQLGGPNRVTVSIWCDAAAESAAS
jgi:hypothetical protein